MDLQNNEYNMHRASNNSRASILSVGMYVYCFGTIAAGVINLIWGNFPAGYQPIQAFGDHNNMNSKVDWFFNKNTKWQKEYGELRTIVLDTGLTEELKWGCPCYTFQNKNIVLIHGFKEYCALLFMKGSLLPDADRILIQQTKHVQSARQIRFTGMKEIVRMKRIVKAFIHEAIEVEKAGLEAPMKKTKEFAMPEELQKQLNENSDFKTAFKSLTPGRQRAYILYFSSAKQSSTRSVPG